MAYDKGLAERIRGLVGDRHGVTEREMFGGVAFLRGGQMFVGVVKDELMCRVGPDAHGEAVVRPGARIMDFSGRPMRGYVFVAPHALTEDTALVAWVEQCFTHVGTVVPRKKMGSGPR